MSACLMDGAEPSRPSGEIDEQPSVHRLFGCCPPFGVARSEGAFGG